MWLNRLIMTTNAVQHPETGDLRLSSISISVITIPGQRRNSTFTIRLLQLSWSHTQNPYLHKKFNVRLFTVCGHVVDSPLRCFHPESLHPPQESSDLFILIHEPWRSILPSIKSSRWDSEFFFFFVGSDLDPNAEQICVTQQWRAGVRLYWGVEPGIRSFLPAATKHPQIKHKNRITFMSRFLLEMSVLHLNVFIK